MGIERRLSEKWKLLFLIRHGESTCNEVNRFAGAVDVPLTALGEAQAREAAGQWQGPVPDRVYVSPLQRARRTAEILFPHAAERNADGPRLLIDARIRERDFGDLTLRNKAFVQREVGLAGYERALYADCTSGHGGEPFSELYQRVLAFLREELHPLLLQGKRVVVVAHKYVIELLARLILRLSPHDGYDLRLPNAKLISALELKTYLHRESRRANNLREWIVLNHAYLLLGALLLGLGLHAVLPRLPSIPPLVNLGLLATATGMSLARVDLDRPRPGLMGAVFGTPQIWLRYGVLPLALGLLAYQGPKVDGIAWLAILLAAPAAITGITVSRCLGGIVLPTVYMIFGSTLAGALLLPPLLYLYGVTDVVGSVALLVAASGAALLVPVLVAVVLRARHPIGTARFAEQNTALAVLLLGAFVVLSSQGIEPGSFRPYGIQALVVGVLLRAVALLLARRGTLYAVDDYVSMSYPNVFLVIVLASVLHLDGLSAIATWLLLPMFALAPLDEWLCRQVLSPPTDARLLAFLGLMVPQHGTSAHGRRQPDSGALCQRPRWAGAVDLEGMVTPHANVT